MGVKSMGLKRIPCRVFVLAPLPRAVGLGEMGTRKMSHCPSLAVAAVPAGALQGNTEPG